MNDLDNNARTKYNTISKEYCIRVGIYDIIFYRN